MSLKEKIAERKLNNEIQDVLYGLHIEATEDFSYIKNSSELEILKESQKYAKILYDIIKTAKKEKDIETYRVLKNLIDEYGKWEERSRREASRGPGCFGIQLILPEDLKKTLNNLYERYLHNEEMKMKKLANEIDAIVLK